MLGPNGEVLLNLDKPRRISYSSAVKPVDRTFSNPFTRLVWKLDISHAKQSPSAPELPSPQGERGKVTLMGHHE